VDLGTFTIKEARVGDDANPIDKAIALLASPNDATRRSGVEALVKACSDPRAAATLAVTLRTHAKADTRAMAAQHLGTCHDKDAVPALIAALGGDADVTVRVWAASILGTLGDASAKPALQKAAHDDKDDGVRSTAEKSLKKL
nr:HEAT repeat domain-containing protein [Deltaproteobacteria bacterium]